MAGDWIKMRTNLAEDPAVVRLASGLNLDRFAIVGRLHKIWSWANEHSIDGIDVPVDAQFLDSLVATPGFAEQLRRVGWLSGRDSSLTFPNFLRHNGESAKSRAMDADRKRRVRKASEKCPDQNQTETGPEKRREEKREKEKCEKEKVQAREDSQRPGTNQPASSEACPLLDRLPEPLNTDEFRAMWMRWTAYCYHRDGRHNEPQLELHIMKLLESAHLGGVSKAIADLMVSIEAGTKGRIYDSSADFTRRTATQPPPKPDPYAGFVHIKRKRSVPS